LSWKTATTKVGRPARRSVAGAAIGERKSIQVRHVAVALDAVDVIEQPAFLELVQRREQPDEGAALQPGKATGDRSAARR
jgi:hypothetical protein